MAKFATGKTLDIGYAAQPNIFLKGEVTGLDLNKPEKFPSNYSGSMVHDATHLNDLENRYDTIIAGEIIEHLDNPQAFLSGCYSILNPGGKLIISTPNPYHPPLVLMEFFLVPRYYFDTGHVNIFLPRFLMRMMTRFGFSNLQMYSGGVGPPFIKFDIPCPYPFCEHIIYIGNKPRGDIE
jgi:SAM-dependent methyltransferase